MSIFKRSVQIQKEYSSPHSNSWILVIAFVLMVLLSIAVQLPLVPNDFFPYVRIGEEIVSTGEIPTTEFMTYTQFGKPVEYPYWLPSLIFMGVFKLGGVTLTALIVMLCTAAFYILLWMCLRELEISPLLSGCVMFILGLSAASFFIARPQIFAFPLFGLSLLILLKWQKSDNRMLWLLPLLTVFWVNLHGSFIIQFFLLLPAIIFGTGNRKKLLIITTIALLATLINIYGFGLWKNTFSVVENESNQLFSMEFQKPTNKGWQANILFGTFLIIPILTAFLKPRVKLLYWIWFLGFGWMALSGVRYGIWYLGTVALLFGLILDPFFRKNVKNKGYFENRKINLIIGIFALIIPSTFLPGLREFWWEQSPTAYSETTPIDAVEWLRQNPHLPGEIWSDFDSSTYLTYALPERKLFMTNRMDDFPVEQYEDYLSIYHGRYNWQSILNKFGINLLLFNYLEQPVFMEAISSSTTWEEIYRDDHFVIYERNS